MKRSLLWISACAVTMLLNGIAQAALPLADKLPDGSLIYVGWAGRTLTFDGSYVGQLVKEPEAQEFFDALKATILANFPEGTPKKALAEKILGLHEVGWKHPMAAALFELKMPGAGVSSRSAEAGKPMPMGAILVDLGDDKTAFDEQLQGLLRLLSDQLTFTAMTTGNVTYQSLATPAGPVGLGYVGNLFFVTLGEGAPERVQALVSGKAKPLSQDATFTAAMKEVATDQFQCGYYMNVAKIYEICDSMLPPTAAASSPADSSFRHQLNALGLGNVTTLAGADSFQDRKMHIKVRIASPGPHQGVLMFLAGEPLEDKNLWGIPADADFVAAVNLSPSKALAEIHKILSATNPMVGMGLQAAIRSGSMRFNIDLEQDLIASMGDQWTLAASDSLGGFLSGIMLTVQLKDPAKFSQTLAKIEDFYARRAATRSQERAEIRTIPFGKGAQIHYVAFHAQPNPFAPAWAVANDRLYVALWPQVLQGALDDQKEKNLTADPTFQSTRKEISGKPSAMLYVNEPQLLSRFYGLLLAAGTVGASSAPQSASPATTLPATSPGKLIRGFLPEMIPSLPKLQKYFSPEITTISSDAKGITFEASGALPLPSMVMAAIPLAPLLGQQAWQHEIRQAGMYKAHHAAATSMPAGATTAPAASE